MATSWDLYRKNTDTGKTFVVEECNRRRIGVVVFNTLHDNMSMPRSDANEIANRSVGRLIAGEVVEHGPYAFSVVTG